MLRAAQEKWLRQDVALSSMAFEEAAPLTCKLFRALRCAIKPVKLFALDSLSCQFFTI